MTSRHCTRVSGFSGKLAATACAAVVAGVLCQQVRSESAETVKLYGVIRDFHKDNTDFVVTPSAGNGHYAGNVGLVMMGTKPSFIGGGYRVNGEWHNAASKPIPPHLYGATVAGGGVVALTTAPTMSGNCQVDSFDSSQGLYGGSNVGPAPTFVAGSPMPTVSEPTGMPALGADKMYSGNGSTTLSSDVHCNNFTIRNNHTVKISGNRKVLVEQAFLVENHGGITMLANSTLTVYLKGTCTFDNNIDGNMIDINAGGKPSNLTIINLGTQPIDIDNHVMLYAVIISPNAPMTMGNNCDFCGNFTGQSLVLANSAGFHNDGSSGPPPTMCGNPLNDTAGVKGINSTGGIPSSAAFNTWYSDVLGVNLSQVHAIELVKNADGVFEYLDNAFHPIDDQLFGNESQAHNYYFTYMIEAQFVHKACQQKFIEFEGADDVWLYVDGKLGLDIGGVLPDTGQHLEVDRITGLVDGETYTLHFYYAQRQTTSAKFNLKTNLDIVKNPAQVNLSGGWD